MAHSSKLFSLSPIMAALSLLAAPCFSHAQAAPESAPAAPPSSTAILAPINVTAPAAPTAGVTGFGSTPLAETPIQATTYGEALLKDNGVKRLADIVKLDPGVGDAYNAPGYWDQLAVRGYALDGRYNYKRDGLPISAQTSIPLDNKADVEILKGLSGIQAGTSAPGGLVNYVVKRPTDAPIRSVYFGFEQSRSFLTAVDIGQRFGVDNVFGVRINAAYESIAPQINDLDGHRSLLSFAGDWRVQPGTLIEAEVETSQRKQRSQPGFSLLGNTLPAPGDPRINLNNQPWSLPNVMNAMTGSLRLQQRINDNWKFTAHAGTQRLRSDDRLAYPSGCTAEGNFDRYCSDGTYDLYDYQSDGERRTTDAVNLFVTGQAPLGATRNEVTTGVMRTRLRERYNDYASNGVGSGNVDGTLVTPSDNTPAFANTNRDERSTELYLRDTSRWTERFSTWFGVRHTRIDRQEIGTDGSGATSYSQSFTTPWLAASYAFQPGQIVYASWGEGIESEVTSAVPQYTNAGAALPAIKSRQWELGIKGGSDRYDWTAAYFNIVKPVSNDIGTCDPSVAGSCTRAIDGTDNHQGVEGSLGYEGPTWGWRGGAQVLRARREGSVDPGVNGLRPVNVPELTIKLQARYNVAQVPGLAVLGLASYDGDRMAITDNSVKIPGYARFDLGLRYVQKTATTRFTWRAGFDNVFDKRAWREAPTQYGHVYLYPLAPRTFRISLQADL